MSLRSALKPNRMLILLMVWGLFLVCPGPANTRAQDVGQEDATLMRASLLVEQRDFQEALDLLEAEYGGTPGIEAGVEALFIMGRAAYGLGQYDRAIDHYKTILQDQPNLVRVRYELGKALASAGRDEEAVREFEEVLKSSPPGDVAEFIKTYLAMQGRAVAEDGPNLGDLTISVGFLYDSNVNTGSSADSAEVYGQRVALSEDVRGRSDAALRAVIDWDFSQALTDYLSWRVQAGAGTRLFANEREYTRHDLSLKTGPEFRWGRFSVSCMGLARFSVLGRDVVDDYYSDTLGLLGQVAYAPLDSLTLAAYATVQGRWVHQNQDLSGTLLTMGGVVRYAPFSWIRLGPGYGFTHMDAWEDRYSYDAHTLSLTGELFLPRRVTLTLKPWVTFKEYREKQDYFDQARADTELSMRVQVEKAIDQGIRLTLSYTFTSNDSNLEIYDYDRHRVEFMFSKRF